MRQPKSVGASTDLDGHAVQVRSRAATTGCVWFLPATDGIGSTRGTEVAATARTRSTSGD